MQALVILELLQTSRVPDGLLHKRVLQQIEQFLIQAYYSFFVRNAICRVVNEMKIDKMRCFSRIEKNSIFSCQMQFFLSHTFMYDILFYFDKTVT